MEVLISDSNTDIPMKLNGGRLFRFDLAETERAKYMLFTWHHIAFDGMSRNIIMSYIAVAYDDEAFVQETYSTLNVASEESQLRATPAYQAAKKYQHFSFNFSCICSPYWNVH